MVTRERVCAACGPNGEHWHLKRNYLKSTIKNLFALSGNECAFPGCPRELVDTRTKNVIGHICHVRSGVTGGPRYEEEFPRKLINRPQNLVLMCQPHHKVIDRNPKKYRTEVLIAIKQKHEATKRDVDPKLSKFQADEFEHKLKKWCADNEAKIDLRLEKRWSMYEDRESIGVVVANSGLTAAFVKDYGFLIRAKSFKEKITGYPFDVTFKVLPQSEQKIPVVYVDEALQAAGFDGPEWQLKAFEQSLNTIDWNGGCAQAYECVPVKVWIEFETLFGEKKKSSLDIYAQIRHFSEMDKTQPLILGLNVPSKFRTE